MASTQPTDVLANLPQEITFLILEHLKWPETLPLRNLNKQWREFMDYYFVKADPSLLRLGSDNKLKLHELSRWTRNITLSKKHISRLQDWSELASQCPRITTLYISFDGVKLRTAFSLMSDFGRFRYLSMLTLERTMYRAIHKLVPLLSTSCPNLQDLRIHVLPANYEWFQHTATWLQRTRIVEDMPQLRSLDLEFLMIYEIYDGSWNVDWATTVNADLHRPIVQLIAAAKKLETIKISTKRNRSRGGNLDSYAKCIAQLHETHPKLQTCHFEGIQLYGTPSLSAISLTLVHCGRPISLSYSIRAAFTPADDEIWNSKLKHFTQKGGNLEIPFASHLEKLEISDGWTVAAFMKQLRDRSCEPGLPLTSLKSLRLSGSQRQREHIFTTRGDLTFADLEHLVTAFPCLEKLYLIDQKELRVTDLGEESVTEEDESEDEEQEAQEEVPESEPESELGVEYFLRTAGEILYPSAASSDWQPTTVESSKVKSEKERGARPRKTRRVYGDADPEAYLRANLPRLKRLTIK